MVQSGFTRKKVESLTLGEKMKKLRNDFRTSLQEVSKATHIQVKYLEHLENGEYDKLPADVYVRGFLRSYARYLNIDEQAFIKLYERERHIQENLGRDTKKFETASFSPASLVITSRTVVVGIIALLVLGAFFYLYREFQSFAAVPRLVILSPHNGEKVETSEVTVNGKTDKGSQVSINNQAVFVGNDGVFSDKLILQPGMNSVTVTTTNRFNKVKTETFSVEANYTVMVPETSAQNAIPDIFNVDVAAKDMPVEISIFSDGTEVFRGTLFPEQTKNVEAKEKLVITSNKGEATFIRFNGGEQEVLAKKRGIAKDVTFTKAGRQE